MNKIRELIINFIIVFLLLLIGYILFKEICSFIQLKPEGDARLVMYNLDKRESKLFFLRLLINRTFFR